MSGFSDLLKTAQKLLNAQKEAERTALLVEFNSRLLAEQANMETILEENRVIREELMAMNNWSHEKQRYELQSLEPCILVYAIKQGMENSDPPHYICANCYTKGKKSYLHIISHENNLSALKCHDCGFQEVTGKQTIQSFKSKPVV